MSGLDRLKVARVGFYFFFSLRLRRGGRRAASDGGVAPFVVRLPEVEAQCARFPAFIFLFYFCGCWLDPNGADG